jgi:hypothetical protein
VIPTSRGRAEAKAKIDKAVEALRHAADVEVAGGQLAVLVHGDQSHENAVIRLRNIAAHIAFNMLVEARAADRFGFYDRVRELESWLRVYTTDEDLAVALKAQAQLAMLVEIDRKLK